MIKIARHFYTLIMVATIAGVWINFFEVSLPIAKTAVTAKVAEPVKDEKQKEVKKEETKLTPIKGKSTHTLKQAKKWAYSHKASDKFIKAADIYWEIGEKMGIRPDVLYAQAAKETAYGKYTGNVTEDMNNFAGVKRAGAVGDERECHESFKTMREGIQGHFNHMSAYIGVDPVEPVHGRYKSVITCSWAGTIKYVEQLSGKWAPAKDYGQSIVDDYLTMM